MNSNLAATLIYVIFQGNIKSRKYSFFFFLQLSTDKLEKGRLLKWGLTNHKFLSMVTAVCMSCRTTKFNIIRTKIKMECVQHCRYSW